MARNPMVKGLAQALAKLKSRPFTANQLTRILKGTSPKFFEAAADQAGLEYDIIQSDPDGNADYEVMDQNYTDQGAAISYIDGKFNRIG